MIRIKRLALYYRERFIFVTSTVSITALFLTVVLIVIQMFQRTGLSPLHYDIFFGIDRVGMWHQTLGAPLMGILVLVTNFIIGFYLFARDKYLSYALSISSALVSVFILLYLIVLITYIS